MSTHGLIPPTEQWAVSRLAKFPPPANVDFGPFSRSSVAGFHFVRWSGRRAGACYVMIPKWAVVSLAVAVFAVAVRGRRRS